MVTANNFAAVLMILTGIGCTTVRPIVSGRITYDGTEYGVTGVVVTIQGAEIPRIIASSVSDSQGRFTLEGKQYWMTNRDDRFYSVHARRDDFHDAYYDFRYKVEPSGFLNSIRKKDIGDVVIQPLEPIHDPVYIKLFLQFDGYRPISPK